MMLRRLLLSGLVCVGAVAVCHPQTTDLHPQVTESDVVAAMREKGITIGSAQVKMLSTIPTRTEHPSLEAVRIEKLSQMDSRVLLRCADAKECIPFYAVVNGLDANQQSSGASAAKISFSRKPGTKVALEIPLVKKGSMATLEIVAPEMLITVPVLCLESGRQGERIKVVLTDHTRTYLAEVVRAGLLRSQL
jgi:hypothetical protein